MNLFQKIKVAWEVRKLFQGVSKVKPGWKTTEFWLVVLPNIQQFVNALQGGLPDRITMIALALLNGAYAIARSIAKKPVPEIK